MFKTPHPLTTPNSSTRSSQSSSPPARSQAAAASLPGAGRAPPGRCWLALLATWLRGWPAPAKIRPGQHPKISSLAARVVARGASRAARPGGRAGSAVGPDREQAALATIQIRARSSNHRSRLRVQRRAAREDGKQAGACCRAGRARRAGEFSRYRAAAARALAASVAGALSTCAGGGGGKTAKPREAASAPRPGTRAARSCAPRLARCHEHYVP